MGIHVNSEAEPNGIVPNPVKTFSQAFQKYRKSCAN